MSLSLFWVVVGGALTGAVGPGISVLYAVYGELITERAGRINRGMEGCMLMGACAGFIGAAETGSATAGVFVAMAVGGGLALAHAWLVVYRGTNQMAAGLALTILAGGLTAYAGRDYVDRAIGGLDAIPVPLLSDIPVVGAALFQQDILAYLAYGLGPFLWAFLRYTRWGLELRAVGESINVAYAAGLDPQRIQLLAIVAGGALAGLGGAHLSVALTHTWSEGMTVGRGFIAVGLVIFAMWSPLRAMVGALLFGGAMGLQLQLQSVGAPVSPFVLEMFPYLIVLAVLAVWTGTAARAMPAGLRSVFRSG